MGRAKGANLTINFIDPEVNGVLVNQPRSRPTGFASEKALKDGQCGLGLKRKGSTDCTISNF